MHCGYVHAAVRTEAFYNAHMDLSLIHIYQILRNKDLKDDLSDMEEMEANMGGYGQETYGDNGNYYEEPAKPMTRKEKKQVKKEEKQRAKEEKRNKKKGNQPEQQQDAYQNPGNGAYQPEQDGRQMNYQDPAPQTWQLSLIHICNQQ